MKREEKKKLKINREFDFESPEAKRSLREMEKYCREILRSQEVDRSKLWEVYM